MQGKSVFRKVIAGWVLLAILPSCTKEQAPIRISINAWPGYEFLFLAEQKGFFREEGVNVQLLQLGSLSDTPAAFERGKIDGMAATLAEVLQAQKDSRRHAQIFLVLDYSNGSDVIMAQQGISSVAQLKGRRVGLEVASLGVFMLVRSLEKAGLQLQDVQMVVSDQSSLAEMFRQQTIDAIVTYPPEALGLQQQPGINTVFSSADIPDEVIDVLALDNTMLQQHPEKASAIIRATYRAMEYARQHPDEAYAVMGNREGLSAQAFHDALQQGIHMLPRSAQQEYFGEQGKLLSAMQTVKTVMQQTGQLETELPVESMINPAPLRAVAVLP